MKPMFLPDELIERTPVVCDSDHPLSLGWKVMLWSTSPHIRRAHRISKTKLLEIGYSPRCDGLHVEFPQPRVAAIFVAPHDDVSKRRFLEVLTHEASHCVDGFFRRAYVAKVDTEVRAYHIDWLVGKLVQCSTIID